MALAQLAAEAGILSSVDSDLVISLYGRLLSKRLFPQGPGQGQHEGPVRHQSYGPWLAERDRCSKVEEVMAARREERGGREAGRLTGEVVRLHDRLTREQLERERERLCSQHRAAVAWSKLLERQTAPLGSWHRPASQPRSLVLENICGTSGTFLRLRRGHCGLTKDRYFLPGSEHLAEELVPSNLLLSVPETGPSLSARLGGLQTVLEVQKVQQVTATCRLPGELVVTTSEIIFISESSSWSVAMASIEAVERRRHQLREVALELFLVTGEARLVALVDRAAREAMLSLLHRQGVPSVHPSAALSLVTRQWRQGSVTNFHYLLALNRLAGRTANDLMQYPVFPWILADYTSDTLDLSLPENFRNLRKPIAVQVEGSEERYRENYDMLVDMGAGLGPYHFASHYSNTGIVLHFLVRLPPFTAEFIKFQDGNFDLPDRSFHKLATSWKMASEVSASDVKELIPQLFYLPEMFRNREQFSLGRRQNGAEVSDVELPPWSQGDARKFVRVHRQALESPLVRAELPHWIDLVFGYKQKGAAALEAVNVFHPATYPGEQGAELDPVEERARQTMIETYGQTPLQLFFSAHPLPLEKLVRTEGQEGGEVREDALLPALSSVRGMSWGSWVGAPGQPSPYIVWQQQQGAAVTALVSLESNEVVGLQGRSVLLHGCQGLPGAVLLSWGHPDSCLHWTEGRGKGEEQVGGGAHPPSDPPSCAASHQPALWIGHTSGLITVAPSLPRLPPQPPALGPPSRLHAHSAPVARILLRPEFGLALTASQEGLLVTWDLHSLTERHHLRLAPPSSSSPLQAAFSATSGDVAVFWAGSLALLTVNLEQVAECSPGETVTALAFSSQEEGGAINCVAAGLQSGLVRLYSSMDLQLLRDISVLPAVPVTALAYSRDSQNLAVASQDGHVTILEKSGSRGQYRTPKYVTFQ